MQSQNGFKIFSPKLRVHCHICSLKGFCPDNIRHCQSSYRIEKGTASKRDLEQSAESTKNCPLLALINAAMPNILTKPELP